MIVNTIEQAFSKLSSLYCETTGNYGFGLDLANCTLSELVQTEFAI